MTARIIDCTIFSNEIDLLMFRLNELSSCVDHHIIVECAYSFSNKFRGLVFPTIIDRLGHFKSKITYLPILCYPSSLADDHWEREAYVRNYPTKYLKDNFNPNDIILLCDLDEIPRPENIVLFKQPTHYQQILGVVGLEMDFYYYNLQWMKTLKWYYAYMTRLQYVSDINQQRRGHKNQILGKAGWHLSYFCSVEQIAEKLRNFSHSEYSGQEYTNFEHIRKAISEGKDLFNRIDAGNQLSHPPNDAIRPTYIHLLPTQF